MFVSPAVDLVLVAALFAVISQTLQLVLMDRTAMRARQEKMKEKNKEYKELLKKGESAKGEQDRVQREMMELASGSMKEMPKMMIASLIIFLPLFGLVSSAYHGFKINLFFPLTLIWDQADWFWWYVFASLFISMIVTQVLNAYDNHKKMKQEGKTNA